MLRTGGSLVAGWQVQGRNIRALILRDMVVRFGRDNIGFVWVILEPMLLTAGVMLIWSLLGSEKNGIKIIEIALTGYMPLTLWRHLSNNVINLFRNSSSLLYHSHITLFDIVASRQVLEFIGTTTALIVVWGTLNLMGMVANIERLDLFILGWLMMAWIGIAVGTAVAALTEVSETAERFIQPLQYLNIPISGAFFFVDWLPPWGQHLILYHPLVHCYEVFRAGYFGPAMITHYDLIYFASCAFFVTFVGVVAVHRVRSRVKLN